MQNSCPLPLPPVEERSHEIVAPTTSTAPPPPSSKVSLTSSYAPTSSISTSSSSKPRSGASDKSKPNDKFAPAIFCKDNTDLIQRQAIAFKQAIKEAKAAEEKRLFIIEIEKNPDRVKELEDRFAAQRKLDQERLIRIKTDFDSIKEAVNKGDLSIKERNSVRTTIPILKTLSVNRFVGLETQEDVILHKLVCEKLHNMQEKNKRWNDRNLPKVDVEAEKNKLNLLLQKQDVLTKMIDLQRLGFGANSSRNTKRSDSASVFSDRSSATRGTQYSWASFGGNSNSSSSINHNIHKAIQHKSKGANVFIPPLKLKSDF